MQELIANQFFEMRKILHLKQAEISQNIDTTIKTESENFMNALSHNTTILQGKLAEISQGEYDFITTEESDNDDNYLPCGEIKNTLEKMLTETQETLNRFLKAVDSLQFGPAQINEVSTQTVDERVKTLQNETSTQTVQEISETSQQISQYKKIFRKAGKGNQEPIFLKKEALSQLETNSLEIFQDEDHISFSPQVEMEEEFEEKDSQKNQLAEKYFQRIKNQIFMEIEAEPQLKLDFSNKSSLNDFFTTLCSEEFWDATGKNKISHLEVNFSESPLTDQQFVRFVQNVLTPLENLTSIMINLTQTEISFEGLQALSQVLKNYKLKTFVLNCSQTSIGYEGIKSLEDGLSYSIQTLENIEIILDSTDVQGEKFLDALMGMTQLKHLKLSFENSQISSDIVSSVVFCLRFLAQNLESLDLNLNGTETSDDDLENFLNHAIFYLEKLKHFKLSLGETLISDHLLINFFQSLNMLAPRLVTFELDLHSTGLTHVTYKHFCERALSKMVNLEHLKLDLSQTEINDASLKTMRLPIRKLQSLTLNLNKTNLSDSGIKIFKEINNLKNIESLNIHFEQIQKNDQVTHEKTHLNSIIEKTVFRQNSNPKELQATNQVSDNHLHYNFKAKKNTTTVILFDMSEKRKILLDLQNALRIQQGHKSNTTLNLSQLLDDIQKFESKTYSLILRQVLTKNHPHPELIPQNLKEWKRKIRAWIERFSNISKFSQSLTISSKTKKNYNSDKVFSRRWLEIYGEKISFREKVIEILKSMSTRFWPIFYERILKFVQEFSCEYKTWQVPSEPKTFWWYDFISREEEISGLWKSLPFPREHLKEEFEEKEAQDMKVQRMEVKAELNQDENGHEECLQDFEGFSSESEGSSEYPSDEENNPEPVQRSGTNLGKKYVTVKIPIKRKIIFELREAILIQKGLQSDPTKVHMKRLTLLIESLDSRVYNNLLIKVLNKNLPALGIKARDIEEWETRLQKWIKNFGKYYRASLKTSRSESKQKIKTESCSSASVHWSSWLKKYGKETSFKQDIRKILQSMPFKCFSNLRTNLFNLLQKLASKNKDCEDFPKLEENTFSSSWWYRFIDENQDIGDLWRNLPLSHEVLKEGYHQ